MTILSGQSGLQWTDEVLARWWESGPNNARMARAMMRLDVSMRTEVFAQARTMMLFHEGNWPDIVEMVTAVALAGGSPRVFVQAMYETTKGMNGR